MSSVAAQADVWVGPLETFKLMSRFHVFYRAMRWSQLTVELIAAPGMLVPHTTCPKELIDAFELDTVIANMRGHTILGAFDLGPGHIVRAMGNVEKGREYLIGLNAIATIMSPDSAAKFFKYLLNEMVPSTARTLTVEDSAKSLVMATSTHVKSVVGERLRRLHTHLEPAFMLEGDVADVAREHRLNLDFVVACIRRLASSENHLRLPVREYTEIALAVLAWTFLDAHVIVRSHTGGIVDAFGSRDTGSKCVELFIRIDPLETTALGPSATWVSHLFPYGVGRSLRGNNPRHSWAYAKPHALAASFLRTFEALDPTSRWKNVQLAWLLFLGDHDQGGFIDRRRLDFLREMSEYFTSVSRVDSSSSNWLDGEDPPVEFDETAVAQSCCRIIALYEACNYMTLSTLFVRLHRLCSPPGQSLGPDLFRASMRPVHGDGTHLLFAALILRALGHGVTGDFRVHANPQTVIEYGIHWMTNEEQYMSFIYMVTGFGTPHTIETALTTARASNSDPILIGVPGLVLYNDFTLPPDMEPQTMPYFKVAAGGAYLGDELVEVVLATPPNEEEPVQSDQNTLDIEPLLPIDLTPDAVHLCFRRSFDEDGRHRVEVIAETSPEQSTRLETSAALTIWSTLLLIIWGDGNSNGNVDLPKFTVLGAPIDEAQWQPYEQTSGQRNADVAVIAAFNNRTGRLLGCYSPSSISTFLFTGNSRGLFTATVGNLYHTATRTLVDRGRLFRVVW